ncbi:MAG: DUF72 domain-containing protein [Spirochaetota bacterium]
MIRIGTSGWNYPHWSGPFYPRDLNQDRWLRFYAERFSTVEINNSFYNLPAAGVFRSWRDSVPRGFVFSVKASRYITHMKKLKDPRDSVRRFMDRASELGEKMGPVLFQLPPRWKVNPERLESFLGELPEGPRYTFEFRDQTWFCPEVYALLRDRGAAFCIYHLAGTLTPREVTADFVYVRLHGPGDAYQGSYNRETLSGWAGAFSSWDRGGRDVYCYFDNDQRGYAARDAGELRGMVSPR